MKRERKGLATRTDKQGTSKDAVFSAASSSPSSPWALRNCQPPCVLRAKTYDKLYRGLLRGTPLIPLICHVDQCVFCRLRQWDCSALLSGMLTMSMAARSRASNAIVTAASFRPADAAQLRAP